MNKCEMSITDIPVTDTPARKAWDRVTKMIPGPLSIPVDLDKLGVHIIQGIQYPALIDEGMHRVARVFDVNGVCNVVFTLNDWGEGPAQLFEDYIDLCARDGVDSLATFVDMCRSGYFLREDTS